MRRRSKTLASFEGEELSSKTLERERKRERVIGDAQVGHETDRKGTRRAMEGLVWFCLAYHTMLGLELLREEKHAHTVAHGGLEVKLHQEVVGMLKKREREGSVQIAEEGGREREREERDEAIKVGLRGKCERWREREREG